MVFSATRYNAASFTDAVEVAMSVIFAKLLRAVRYLFVLGNVFYWGLHALASTWLGWHQHRQAEAVLAFLAEKGLDPAQIESAGMALLLEMQAHLPPIPLSVLAFYVVTMLLMLAKMCDGIMRISEGLEHEPVPLAPVSIVPFSIVFKYFAGIILWAIPWLFFLFTVKFASWAMLLMVGFFWVLAPAMLMNLVGNNSLASMMSPASWVVTIRNLGWQYAAIILIPIAFAVVSGFIAGFLGAVIGEVAALVLESVVVTFSVALTWVYCGYFMRADAPDSEWTPEMREVLALADTRLMSEAEQRVFAQDMLAVDVLLEEGAGGIEEMLAPYVRRDPVAWFPAFVRQYAFLQKRGGREALRQLEDRMLARAASGATEIGERRLYDVLQPSLRRIAEEDPLRLEGDWIYPLSQLANAQGDHEMVLRLTRDFAERYPHHSDAVGNAYLAARALDRLGRRDEAIAALEQLLARFPDHARAAQIRHTLALLQKPS